MNPRRHASFGYFAASLGPGTPFRFASSMPWQRNHDGPSLYLSRSVCVGTPNPGTWNCDKFLNYKRSGHCLHFCFCTLCQEESPQKKKNTFLDPPGRQPTPQKKIEAHMFFQRFRKEKTHPWWRLDPEPGHEAEVSTACHGDLPPWQGWWIAATSESPGKTMKSRYQNGWFESIKP